MTAIQTTRRQRTRRLGLVFALAVLAMLSQFSAAQLPRKVERQFVPVDQFQAILERDRHGVLLPQKEFEALWQAAQANTANRPPGVPALVVTQVAYSGEVRDRQLVVQATVKFRQFENGWHVLPLNISNLGIESALVGNDPARLARGPQAGSVQFFHDRTGDATLTLTLVTPLAVVGSDQVAAFGLVDAAVAELRLTAPAGKHLLLDEQPLDRPAETQEPATYVLAVGGRPDVRLRLTDRQDEQKTDRLIFATSTIGVDASPGEITWQSITNLQAFGASFNQLIVNVPERLEIADVQSPGLEAWDLAADPDNAGQTRITLNYRQPITGARTVRVRGVLAMPSEEAWQIPMLTIKNITSHVGHLVVTHPHAVRVQFLNEQDVRRSVALTENGPQQDFLVPIADRSAPQIFEFWSERATLELVMRSRERELIANIQNFLDFQYESVRYIAEVTLVCRYAPLFEVDLEVPAEWTPQLVAVNGEQVTWQDVSEEAGVRRVRLTLANPLIPGAQLKIRLEAVTELETWPPADEAVAVALPQLTLPQVQLFDGRYFLNGSPDFELKPADLDGLTPVTFAADGAERTAYEYQDTEVAGSVEITRRPTQLSAQTLTFVRLEPRSLEALLEARITLEGSGRKQLKLSLPEAIGTSVRFTLMQFTPDGTWQADAGGIEQSPAEPADGRIVWTLTTDRRLYGEVGLFVQATLPRAEADTTFTVPDLLVLDAERQHGIVAIEGRSEQSLEFQAFDADRSPLREVDPADIPAPISGYLPQERIVAAFHAFRVGQSVSLTETRFDRTAVPTAVCRQLNLRSILGDSGRWQHEAEATFAAIGVQSLLVELPAESVLWATLLDGEPIEVRRVGNAYLIPLSGGTPGADRTLRIYYNNDANALGTFGKIEQTPPRLAVDVLGEPQPLEILDQHWNLYAPGQLQFVKNDGEFQQSEELPPVGLLAGIPNLLARVSWEHVGNVLMIAAIALIVLFVVDRGLRKWSLGRTLVVLSVLLLVGIIVLAVTMPAAKRGFDSVGSVAYTADDVEYSPAATTTESSSPMMSGEAGFGAPGYSMPAPSAAPMGEDVALQSRDEFIQGSQIFESDARQSKELPQAFRNRKPATAAEPQSETAPTEAPAPPAPQMALPNAPAEAKDGPADPFDGMLAGQQAAQPPQMDAPPGEAQPGLADREGRLMTTALGARLSVDMQLEVPAGHRLTELRYYGTRQEFESSPLRMFYLNQESSGILTGLVVIFTLGVCWILRARTALLLLCLVLGVALPLGLAGLAPAEVYFIFDGILIGALIAAAIWAASCVWCCCCRPLCAKLCGVIGSRTFCRTTATLLVLGLSSLATAGADEKPQQTAAPAAPESLIPSGIATRVIEPVEPKWTVITPYDPKQSPLSADKVFLTAAQFRELWNAAHPDQPLHGKPPAGSFVSAAGYVAELERAEENRGAVKVTARLVIQHLGDGPQTVALPFQRVAIESATLDDAPAAISAGGDPNGAPYSLTTETAGLHLLDVVFRLPVQLAGEAGQFSLPLASATPGSFTFQLPGSKLNARVNGATSAFRKLVEGDTETIVVPLPETGSIAVAWAPPQAAAGVDRVVQVESQLDARVSDAGLTVRKTMTYRVRQGAVEELTFRLPTGWSLQSISGQDVGGWQLEGEEDARQLRVFLRRSVDDATALVFDFFQSAEIGVDPVNRTVPSIVPLDVTSEAGTVGLFAEPHFILRGATPVNATRIDNGQVPQPQIAPGPAALQLAFRYSRADYEIGFTILRKEPEAKSTSEHGANVGRTRTHLASHFQLDLSGAPRSRFAIGIPEGYVVLDVQATSLADWYQAESAEGDPVLILELPEPVVGRLDISVTGYLRKFADDTLAEIIVPRLLDVTEDRTHLAIWGIDGDRITSDEVDGWQPIDVGRLSAALRGLSSAPPQLAFEASQVADRYLSIEIMQTPPQLSADSVTVVNVTDTAIVYQIALRWEIQQAAAERLIFLTPDWLAGKLDFTDAVNVRNYSSELTDDGRVRWTVLLARPQRGEFFLSPLAIIPIPTDKVVPIPRLSFERTLTPNEVDAENPPSPIIEKQRHFAALLNGSSSQLNVVDAALLEPVAADALPIRRDNTSLQQATDIFRLRPERALPSWSLTMFERQRGAEAIVNHSDLMTVLARDGGWRMQADFLIRNRARQFLPLKIPAGARLLSAYVKGQPVRPVTTKLGETTIYLFPLPKASEADLSFTVTVTLAGRLTTGNLVAGVRWIGEEIDLPAPEVVTKQESPELGIPVTRTRWTVWVPDRLTAEEVDDIDRTNLSRQQAADAEVELRLTQLREANDLLLSVKGKSSLGVQGYALDNVKSLNDELSVSLWELEQHASGDKLSELRREQERLNLNYREAEGTLAQQADVAENGQLGLLLNSTGNNFNDFSSEQQLQLLREGNRALYMSNGALGIQIDQNANEQTEFGFGFGRYIEEERAKEQAAGKMPGRSGAIPADRADQQFSKRLSNSGQQEFYSQEKFNSAPNASWVELEKQQRFSDNKPALKSQSRMNRIDIFQSPSDSRSSGLTMDSLAILGAAVADADKAGQMQFDGGETMWTSTAGLSLDVAIPPAGHKLTFTKVGGNPRLALNIKPGDAASENTRLGWSLFWIAIAIAVVAAFRNDRWRRVTLEQWLCGAIVAGLSVALLFPPPIALGGIVLLLAGGISLVVHRFQTRPTEPTEPPATSPEETPAEST